MVGVGRCDIDDVDIGIFDEFFIGAVRGRGGRTSTCFKKIFGSRAAAGGSCGCDGVGEIGDLTGCWVYHEIFREHCR